MWIVIGCPWMPMVMARPILCLSGTIMARQRLVSALPVEQALVSHPTAMLAAGMSTVSIASGWHSMPMATARKISSAYGTAAAILSPKPACPMEPVTVSLPTVVASAAGVLQGSIAG